MSKQVSVAEAKRDLTKLLREVEEKQMEIVVTRRGAPFMVILRFEDYERLERLRAYLEMVRISEELKDSQISATEIYEESRRELEERY
ncbi:MAG: type II toxin-antitoxin system Phd/YefM family antitoxin [Candidatus Bipolaricaulia bacterium]